MKDLIKAIRTAANMNQEQFASSLGTTPLSINRWENGKTLPNRMAQTQLYNFCKERSIDVAKLIVDTKAYADTDNKLILYHGSKKGITGDVAPISREECDFGRGFYMGTSTLQPLTLICNEDKPKFYAVELDLTGLKVLTVDVGMDWAMLIAYHRKEMESAKGTAVYEKYAHMADGYDVIIGYIANDRMYTELFRFFNKTLTDVALINCLSALDLGKQYVAISEKACRQIKILKEEPLSPLELALLKDMSAERRKEGVALAEEIEVKYRREGKFFDEILRGE
jgi:transcriptional regulator with XRE-family HTH domain